MTKRKENGHWDNEDNLLAEAQKYTTRLAFANGSRGAYQAAHDHPSKDKIFAHMESAKGGFDPTKAGIVYYIRVDRGEWLDPWYLIGITNRTVKERYSAKVRKNFTVLSIKHYEVGQDAYDYEQATLRDFDEDRVDAREWVPSGGTECFSHDVLNLDKSYCGAP